MAASAAACLGIPAGHAQTPSGAPQVVAGSATFTQQGATRTIEQQSGAAILNWQDLSVRPGELLRFLQPDAQSAVLNRVLGGQPSLIDGQLQANGSVYLINPRGVVVGPQGRIDVGAFFASTLDVSDADFLRGGPLRFAGDSRAGVQNLGHISASQGDVMLVAYTVRNAGTLEAPRGVAGLAAGSEVLYTRRDDQRLAVQSGLSAEGLEKGVENTGLIAAAQAELKAAGGNIYSLAINQAGAVRATGVVNRDGRVLLVADGGDVEVSGEITARNADGNGGRILVGGGWQGRDASVANAANARVTAGAKIDVSAAGESGHGGEAVVWSDGTTQFAGSIAARGGSIRGDGGQMEVSGLRRLDFTGAADASAPGGRRGQLLLDPDAIIISTAASQDVFSQGGFFQAQAVPSYINRDLLQTLLASTDVEIRTGDSVGGPAGFNGISVNADLEWTSASNLKLVSGDTIALNANITGANGSLTLMPGSVSAGDGSTGAITLAANRTVTVNTLTIERSSLAAAGGANIGAIDLAGTVIAGTVDLVRQSGGVTGNVSLANAANQIGTLRGSGAAGAITGDLRVNDSAGGLVLAGNLTGVAGAVQITTTGNLTVASGAAVQNTGASDLVLASRGGSFLNQANATAVDAAGAGRYLIYSDSPANTSRGGLTGATTYNRTFTANAPATITATGDRFLYSLAPVLTFTADNLTRTYGAANPTLTYAVSGLVSGDTLAQAVSGTPSLSTAATTATGAGTAAINVANGTLAATDLGYGLAFQPGTLTISRAPLTVTADNATRTYGAANPAFTASYSGLVNGDTGTAAVSGLSFNTTATAASAVGNYTLSLSGGTSANYTLTLASGTLRVNPASLTITADNATRTYGAANPAFTAGFAGFVNSDTSAVVSGLTLSTSATSASPVGNYTITAAGATAANYTISFAPGTLTIDRAPLTIAANNASRLFGAANPAFTALYNGLVNGDNSSVVSGLVLSTGADTSSPVGTYAINASGATATNYAITFQPGTLTIANALLTITANSFARTYGAANPTFTASYSGFTGGDTAAVVTGLQFNTSATMNSGVGNYTITPFGASAPNYGINYQTGTLTISPAALTLRANDFTRTYGAANPTFTGTFTGLVAGDTAASISGAQFGTTATAASGVGSYTITASGATNPNYSITFQPGTLTVDRAALTIRADNLAKTYGAANPALTASFTGLVNGDSTSVVSGLSLATAATAASGVGSYAINASGGTAANYAITFQPGTLTVNPASLTLAADNVARTYGAANPTFTATPTGLVGSDTSAVVTGLRFDTTATSGSPVGTYTITPSGASATNYSIAYTNGVLTINPAALTIRATDVARTYGAANPTFGATYTGFVNGDTAALVSGLTFATAATASSGVGTYTITPSGAVVPNYTLTFQPGTLTVDRAPLTITPLNASRTYGAANPTFTAGFSGLVNGDTSAVVSGLTLGTAATTASGVGTYSITAAGGVATNYAITYGTGQLSVTPATLTVAAGNATRVYGDANPTFTGTISGFVNGESSSVLTAAPVYSTAAGLTSNVGNYTITGSGATAANYTFSYQPGTLSVTPAALTVRANDLTRVYGDANPTFTYSVTGLKNGDSESGKFFISVLGSTITASAAIGNYGIQLTGTDVPNDNYTTTFAGGTLTVARRPLTIRPNDVTRTYGAANPALTTSLTGLASFDSAASILNLQVATPVDIFSGVGTYVINASGAVAPNYAITYEPGVFTVTRAPLTVRVNDAARDYGVFNPAFSATYSGFVNGDSATSLVGSTISTTATITSNVGAYPITFNGTSSNYAITATPGTLTINRAPLDVTIAAVSRPYGDPNPTSFPAVAQGLRFGETPSSIISLVSTADARSPVGTYPLSGVSISPNYQVRTVSSSGLQVTPRPLTVVFDSVFRVFGDPNPSAFTYTVASGSVAPFDTLTGVLGANPGVTTATTLSDVGRYPITLAASTNPNYAITASGALNIRPRPVVLTAGNASTVPGGLPPVFTATASNLPAGVTTAQAFPALTYSTTVFDRPVNVGGGVFVFPVIPDDPGTSIVSSLITPDGYQSSTNYEVTRVVPGVLSTTTRSTIYLPADFALTTLKPTAPKPVGPQDAWSRGSSFGLPPSVNGILFSLIKDRLALALLVGETGALEAMLGADYAKLTKDGKLDDAALAAALDGFHTNKEKQALILPFLLDYVTKLTEPGAKLTTADMQLLSAMAPFVARARDEIIESVEAAKNKWYEDRLATASGAPIALVSEYTPIYPPYNEFMRTATDEAVARRVANINLGTSLGAAATGATVASSGLTAVYTFTALKAFVFMEKSKAGLVAGLSSAGGSGATAAIVFVAAAAGIAAGTVQAVKASEAENRYNELIEQKGQPISLTGFNTGDKSKGLLAAALLSMMGESVNVPPSP